MDTITQALLGAVCGNVVARHKLGKRAARWGALGGALPDIDSVAELIGPWAGMEHHRGVTHALWFGPVVGIMLGWLLWRRFAGLRQRMPDHVDAELGAPAQRNWWMLLFAVSILSHPLLDLFTAYGTQLWTPFTHTRYSWNGIGIIDPVYSVVLIIGLLWGKTDVLRKRASGVALLLTSAYLFYGVWLNNRAIEYARVQLESQGVELANVDAYPRVLQIFLRRVVARSAKGDWYIGQLSMWAPHQIQFHRTREVDSPLLLELRRTEHGRLFEWFALNQTLGHVERDGGVTIVSIGDMRYGDMTRPERSMWGVRRRYDSDGRPLGEVERFRSARPDGVGAALRQMLSDTFYPRSAPDAASPSRSPSSSSPPLEPAAPAP